MPEHPSEKCAHCSVVIGDGEPAFRNSGVWYHERCWRILRSSESVRASQRRRRASDQRIERTLDRIGRTYRPSAEPPVVLCVVCRLGIATVADLAMTGSGPMHLACKPAPEGEAR
jgi:hypothetical protein